jgi:hypothetical protein
MGKPSRPGKTRIKSAGVRIPRLYPLHGIKPQHTAIYFALARDRALGSQVAYLKVGFSTDPITRLVGFNTSSPLPIVDGWFIEVPERLTRQYESVLHALLSPFHIHGEWFRVHIRSRDERTAILRALVRFFVGKDILQRPHRINMREALAAYSKYASDIRKTKHVSVRKAIEIGYPVG